MAYIRYAGERFLIKSYAARGRLAVSVNYAGEDRRTLTVLCATEAARDLLLSALDAGKVPLVDEHWGEVQC